MQEGEIVWERILLENGVAHVSIEHGCALEVVNVSLSIRIKKKEREALIIEWLPGIGLGVRHRSVFSEQTLRIEINKSVLLKTINAIVFVLTSAPHFYVRANWTSSVLRFCV